MKILFLDWDGVLNTTPKLAHNPEDVKFYRLAIINLEYLLNKIPDLKIVVSSYWRYLGLEKVKEIMKKNSVDPRRITDITGQEKADGREREYQIAHWLAEHPEVEKFVIFDDDKEFNALKPKLVKINPSTGLNQANVEKAMEILGE
jgi:hypothetical protein